MLHFLDKNAPFPAADFPKGAVLLVDKPLGWTSFDVVNKLRWNLCKRLGVKRLKVGHAGTLDPLASGLLILCVGDHTKRIDEFQAMPKEYTGTFTFGATTPSFDLEKPVDAIFPTAHLTPELLEEKRHRFLGEIQQIPPMFSAVKVDGKRLYRNARTGEEVELEPRTVQIHEFEIGLLRPVSVAAGRDKPLQLNAKPPHIMLHPDYPDGLQADFRVACGKGTYIRSLAHDLGEALGSGAYLSALRRTRTGGFSVENAASVADWVAWISG